ncbi:MAG: hypothetical protein LUE17_14155 [Planctomycetaceae bacterium]|nr:hypothetical protein [Planctomycetaceae bacterium]
MLDIIADILIDLIGGKPPQKSAQPRRRARSAADGIRPETPAPSQHEERMERERVERERLEQAPRPEEPRTMTLEDVIRRLSGEEERPPAPPPQPEPVRPVRQAVAGTYRPAAPRPQVPAEARSLVAKTLDALPDETLRSTRRAEHRYVTTLRNNPKAAQDALVYAEIFGRPLAERDNHW